MHPEGALAVKLDVTIGAIVIIFSGTWGIGLIICTAIYVGYFSTFQSFGCSHSFHTAITATCGVAVMIFHHIIQLLLVSDWLLGQFG